MNVKAITNDVIKSSKSVMLKNTGKLAGIILGTGLLFSSAFAKANELKNDTFQKERTEFVSDDSAEVSGDKTLVGEAILGCGILTYMGLCLLSMRGKKAK